MPVGPVAFGATPYVPDTVTKKIGIALAALAGLTVVAVVAWFIFVFINTREPPEEERVCECELLKEWAAGLPLTSGGDHLEPIEVGVVEGINGFSVSGRRSALGGDVVEALERVLSRSGFSVEPTDNPDVAGISVYPGSNTYEGPWSFRITVAGDEIQLGIGVVVDGSPWGLERAEDLHRLYLDDPALALAAQEERQQRAIEILQPLKDALEGMVEAG